LGWGLVVVNAAVLGKILWAIVNAGADGFATLVPVGGGLLVIDAIVLFAARWFGIPVSLRGGSPLKRRTECA